MISLGAARLALFGLTGLAFGWSLFAPRSQRGVAALALAAMAANALWLAVLSADMFEVPLSGLTGDMLRTVLAMPAIALAFQVRTGLLLAAVAAARRRWLAVALTGAALASLVWTGHAGAAPPLHQLADAAHLLAAGAWLGAVLCLWRGVVAGEPAIAARAAAFARPGAVIVAVLVGSGLFNGWALLAAVPLSELAAALWAKLMLAKLLLFGGVLLLAWRHRTRLVPALQTGQTGAAARLGRSLAVEAMLLIGIFTLVALAGQLDPAGG